MDFILEILFDLALESGAEVANNKKIKKWIRYPLVFLISLFILSVIFTLFIVGIIFILDKETTMKIAGILFIIFDIFLIISIIKKLKKKTSKT